MVNEEKSDLEKNLEAINVLYPFKSHFIDVHGYKYHYIDEGKGEHAIVMVHGNPTWSFMFRHLITHLSKKYRIIAVDHLGCGLSEKPQEHNYRLEDHIDNLETLLLQKKLEKITLLFHDWGGAISMGFAIRHARRIKGLIIMNSAAFSFDKYMPWQIGLCRIPFFDDKFIRELNLFVLGAQYFTTVKPMPALVKTGYRLPYDNYENRIGVLSFVRDIPTGPESQSYESLLEIEHGLWRFRDHPATIIWGMRDWCFDARFLVRWREYYPQATVLELPKAGHLLLEDNPEEILQHVKNFMVNVIN